MLKKILHMYMRNKMNHHWCNFRKLCYMIIYMPPRCNGFINAPLPFHFPMKVDLLVGLQGSGDNYNEHSHVDKPKPFSTIAGYASESEENEIEHVLTLAGFQYVTPSKKDLLLQNDEQLMLYTYRYIKASGMLKLVESEEFLNRGAPKWIPVQSGEEKVLVDNGWSFLDPDEAEPLSAFDIDAANAEGQYMPKWGEDSDASLPHYEFTLSSLGFDIQSMSREEVLDDAKIFLSNASQSQSVLLDGATDNPGAKITNNGYDFSGSVRDGDIDKGLFVCAIGGLPLFTTANLSPTTASSGWLSFAEPVSHEHITLVYPERSSNDQRIEVICTRSQCHLGHYFGKGEGYCINASALNFISIDATSSNVWNKRSNPISWHTIMMETTEVLPSQKMLQQVILRNAVPIDICLGAGCFWHVEFALRRLPGIINTTVGYNGGMTTSPTYKDICTGGTNHAEVVMCKFDPAVLDPRVLIDCFLAMHDPTNIRSHGNRAKKTGQYRSCIFVSDKEMESIALSAINDCSKKLGKLLSTVVEYQTPKDSWIAETRHQRHDERKGNKTEDNLRTLAPTAWLMEYGRRSESIWGSSESIMVDDEDDGMARMMI